jgi:hypothetical protein
MTRRRASVHRGTSKVTRGKLWWQPTLSQTARQGWGNLIELISECLRSEGFSDCDGELGFAGVGGIVEGFAGAIAFGGLKEEAMLDVVGKSCEAGFAVDVGVDLEIEFANAPCAVGDVNFDGGVVDGGAGAIGDDEIGGAGADGSVEGWDGVRVGSGLGLGCWESCEGRGGQERAKEQDWE